MRIKSIFLVLAVALSACNSLDSHLPESVEYRKYDPAVKEFILNMRKYDATAELKSVMVLKNGEKILEYYDHCYGPEFLNICWSVSKTFTATAVGFAVQDGLMSVDGKIVDYLNPEQLPSNISDTLASLTIYDLLRMSSGLKLDPLGRTSAGGTVNVTKEVLEGGFSFAPGKYYKYNSHNTYLLSVAVQNVTGTTVAEYLDGKLFKPLGIKKFHWDISPEGYSMGGWGLYLQTESLAKMGQWMLQKGEWNGKRLLNEEWFDAAMSQQINQYQNKGLSEEEFLAIDADWRLGYGYQMWMCQHGGSRLDGANGQWVVILPEQNAVIVVTGNCKNTHKEFDGIWNFLFPLVSE